MILHNLYGDFVNGLRGITAASAVRMRIMNAGLSGVLEAHREWIESNGREGHRGDLRGADLRGADLREVDFRRIDLSGADLSGANLFQARLNEAKLFKADLSDADLRQANLGRAKCRFTVFTNIDLSETKGLDSILHLGPSRIGVDTLFKSKGEIPRVFLEGCGVPELLIDYLPSLVQSLDVYPYYTCFISFAEPDEAFSRRLYEDLKARTIRCWRWREDATWGKSLRSEIDQAVRVYDKLIVICSRDSLDRRPVQRDILRALQKEESERREVLIPIAIDDYLLGDWDHALKTELVNRVVGKFPKSGKGKAYEEALGRLVEGLKKDLVKGSS